jgi:uncharacterized membrane protein
MVGMGIPFMNVIFVVIIGFILYSFYKLFNNTNKDQSLIILNEKLAHGEICERDYEAKKALLFNK